MSRSGWRVVFFVKQKTAYEMRISDWSSDVCSSDLSTGMRRGRGGRSCGWPHRVLAEIHLDPLVGVHIEEVQIGTSHVGADHEVRGRRGCRRDRKSVV